MIKAASLAYALLFFLLLFEYGDAGSVLPSAVVVLGGLVALWFPVEIGGFLGPSGTGLLGVQRPSLWVQRAGWFLLIVASAIAAALS
jgi:hypothetical protein